MKPTVSSTKHEQSRRGREDYRSPVPSPRAKSPAKSTLPSSTCQRCNGLREEKGHLEQKVRELTLLCQSLQRSLSAYEKEATKASGGGDGSVSRSEQLGDLSSYGNVEQLIKLQSIIRGFLIRRRFRKVVQTYGGSDQASACRKRIKIIQEIQSSEATYLKGLEDMILIYADPLLGVLDHPTHETIFANVGFLASIHRDFCRALTLQVEQLPMPVDLGALFLDLVPKLDAYKFYTERYNLGVAKLNEIAGNPAVSERISRQGWEKQLASLLITPIQRVPRYCLLLRELQKYTTDEYLGRRNIDEALRAMMHKAGEINEHQRSTEGRRRLAEISDLLVNMSPKTLMPVVKAGYLKLRESQALGISHAWTDKYIVLRGDNLYCLKKESDIVDYEKRAIWTLGVSEHLVVEGKGKEEKKDPTHQIWLIEKESKDRKPKVKLAGETPDVAFQWLENLRNAQAALELGLYTRLNAPHRIVVKEGPLSLFSPNPQDSFNRHPSVSGSPYAILFTDMLVACIRAKSGALTITEVIHVPSLQVVADQPEIPLARTMSSKLEAEDEDASAAKKTDVQFNIRTHTPIMSRNCLAESVEAKLDWIAKIRGCWQRFYSAHEKHEGTRQVTVLNTMADLKRQMDRKEAERAFYQAKMEELVNFLYNEERTRSNAVRELRTIEKIAERRKGMVEADDISHDRRIWEDLVHACDTKIAELEQEVERMTEMLMATEMKISQIHRERDDWAQYLEIHMTVTQRPQ